MTVNRICAHYKADDSFKDEHRPTLRGREGGEREREKERKRGREGGREGERGREEIGRAHV